MRELFDIYMTLFTTKSPMSRVDVGFFIYIKEALLSRFINSSKSGVFMAHVTVFHIRCHEAGDPVFAGEDPRSFGFYGIPISPKSGNIAKRDILRWMIGFDKQIWARKLNKTSMFFTSFQYFGQWIQNHQDDTVFPVSNPDRFVPSDGRTPLPYTINSITGEPVPDFLHFPHVKKTEHILTLIINTNYKKGSITPQMAAAYDLSGVWLFLPSINYIREPFRFGIQYAGIVGVYKSFGVFRDRDQISFTFTYLLN